VRWLQREPGVDLLLRSRRELNLTDQAGVRAFSATAWPMVVCLAVAQVGGILTNDACPAELIHENLA